jgi:hypothetical protein
LEVGDPAATSTAITAFKFGATVPIDNLFTSVVKELLKIFWVGIEPGEMAVADG